MSCHSEMKGNSVIKRSILVLAVCVLVPGAAVAVDGGGNAVHPAAPAAPSFVRREIEGEPYLIHCSEKPRRIVLYLHTWSNDLRQVEVIPGMVGFRDVCVVSPNFGGPNNTAAALGSDDSLRRIDVVRGDVMRRTGLSHVDILAASGGTMAAMNYMGAYPGKIRRASLWLPIYDLALLYRDTADTSLRSDMVAALGSPPVGPDDARYIARSPRKRLANSHGPTIVYLNVGRSDTTSPPQHGRLARDRLASLPGYKVNYREWSIPHVFTATQVAEGIKQLDW